MTSQATSMTEWTLPMKIFCVRHWYDMSLVAPLVGPAQRQVKSLYYAANTLRESFSECFSAAENTLDRAYWHCIPRYACQLRYKPGTEFMGERGGHVHLNFWTGGTSNLLSPPTFCDKKWCNCANFMVTLQLEMFPRSIKPGNEKNEHYHWIIYRHSIQISYVNWIVMIVENCVG